ncbi:hypothetical protein VYU27_000419 [Nannochloropsis oceanica]
MLLLALAAATATRAASSAVDTLGIPPAAASVFGIAKQQGKFTCLTDKNKVISFDKVNDNFCDCPDGSDEPGTSACAPEGRFYCLNEGHKGASIPSSKVNDGVCEFACCDGSDEAPGVCPNRCVPLAAARNEERMARRKVIEGGMAKKMEYIKNGEAKMESRLKELASLQAKRIRVGTQITEARTQKEVEEAKEMVARREAVQEAAAKLSGELGVDGMEKEKLVEVYRQLKGRTGEVLKVVLEEIKLKAEIKEEKEGEKEEEEEGEGKREDTTEESRQKEAALMKERLMNRREKGGKKEDTFFKKQLGPVLADDEEEVEHDESIFDDHYAEDEDDEEDEEGEDEEDEEEEEETSGKKGNKEKGEEVLEELNPILKDMLREAEEGVNEPLPSAEAARKALTEAEKEEWELNKRVKEIESEGEEDYGGGFEFYLLRGKCFTKMVNKYKYEMCPYKEAQQLEGSAVSGTKLGKWEGMERLNASSSIKTAGREDILHKFIFRHGAKCWNGPERSLTVLVGCGLEDEVVSVNEPSMCEYEMEFRTPAACSSVLLDEEEEEEGGGEGWHAEL